MNILLHYSTQSKGKLKCQIIISFSTTVECTSPQYLYIYTSYENTLKPDGLAWLVYHLCKAQNALCHVETVFVDLIRNWALGFEACWFSLAHIHSAGRYSISTKHYTIPQRLRTYQTPSGILLALRQNNFQLCVCMCFHCQVPELNRKVSYRHQGGILKSSWSSALSARIWGWH